MLSGRYRELPGTELSSRAWRVSARLKGFGVIPKQDDPERCPIRMHKDGQTCGEVEGDSG